MSESRVGVGRAKAVDGTGRELATPTRVFTLPRPIEARAREVRSRAPRPSPRPFPSAPRASEGQPVVPAVSVSYEDDWADRPTNERLADDVSDADSTNEIVELPSTELDSTPDLDVLAERPSPKLIFSDTLHGPTPDADRFYPSAWPALNAAELADFDEPSSKTITPPAPEAAERAVLELPSQTPAAMTGHPAAWAASMRPPRSRWFVPALVAPLVVAAAAWGAVFGLHRGEAKSCAAREPRIAVDQRTPLAAGAGAGAALPQPPSQGCLASASSRVLARRAQIGAGLDLTSFETGFGVGLAGGAMEAVGLRVDGSGLRVAETLRVKSPAPVSHVAAVPGRDDEADSLDVRVDQGDHRTVMVSDATKALRLIAQDGAISVLYAGAHGPRARFLWSVPMPKPSAEKAASAKAKSGPAKPVTEVVRAAGRDDGGAVVALRRSTGLWLGVVDASLGPAGALVPLSRKGTLGTPALSPWGGGGAVAWAERPQGEQEWSVMVATFSPDGAGATNIADVRAVAKGMSPAITELPDGDLLLAYAEGPAGAHRVVTMRLDRQLTPRGEPLVVSPPSINAGQPAVAVRLDGRALVAYFSAEKPRATTAPVLATPLACDPGL